MIAALLRESIKSKFGLESKTSGRSKTVNTGFGTTSLSNDVEASNRNFVEKVIRWLSMIVDKDIPERKRMM